MSKSLPTKTDLTFLGCKVSGCLNAVVGSSITGHGHVCKRHNTAEWGDALARNKDPYYRDLGVQLKADAALLDSVKEWQAASSNTAPGPMRLF